MANKKARILAAGQIGGISYKPDDVVNLPESLIKAHAASVDAHKDAVAYALSVNGGQVIEHVDPAEIKAALAEEIAKLESALAEATEATKPAVEQVLAEKRARLAAIG